jgi:hypothetical protein
VIRVRDPPHVCGVYLVGVSVREEVGQRARRGRPPLGGALAHHLRQHLPSGYEMLVRAPVYEMRVITNTRRARATGYETLVTGYETLVRSPVRPGHETLVRAPERRFF